MTWMVKAYIEGRRAGRELQPRIAPVARNDNASAIVHGAMRPSMEYLLRRFPQLSTAIDDARARRPTTPIATDVCVVCDAPIYGRQRGTCSPRCDRERKRQYDAARQGRRGGG